MRGAEVIANDEIENSLRKQAAKVIHADQDKIDMKIIRQLKCHSRRATAR